jgi:hypothetical protein
MAIKRHDAQSNAPEESGSITQPTPIDVPLFYANLISVSIPGNDANILFMRPRPASVPNMSAGQLAIIAEPVAVLQMSMRTLKDLYLSIGDQLATYEKDFGILETEFTRLQRPEP